MMTPFTRMPLTSCPYKSKYVNEWDRAMKRYMANTLSWANKSLMESHKFADTHPDIIDNDKEFKVKMDVSHFSPDELKVTFRDGYLQVEGNHEEKSDKYGTIQRSFVRKYSLPPNFNEDDSVCEISKDGVLTVGVAKLAIGEKKGKNIPIKFK
ncbi:Protein lethal(2)essential for life [Strongyloides ratti]|nr:Protein lethal(2)essential for life [Strongyloides ratti]CEF62271.1 Protein lethal(2)essential for life [Strongyloides ratti]